MRRAPSWGVVVCQLTPSLHDEHHIRAASAIMGMTPPVRDTVGHHGHCAVCDRLTSQNGVHPWLSSRRVSEAHRQYSRIPHAAVGLRHAPTHKRSQAKLPKRNPCRYLAHPMLCDSGACSTCWEINITTCSCGHPCIQLTCAQHGQQQTGAKSEALQPPAVASTVPTAYV